MNAKATMHEAFPSSGFCKKRNCLFAPNPSMSHSFRGVSFFAFVCGGCRGQLTTTKRSQIWPPKTPIREGLRPRCPQPPKSSYLKNNVSKKVENRSAWRLWSCVSHRNNPDRQKRNGKISCAGSLVRRQTVGSKRPVFARQDVERTFKTHRARLA